MSELERLKEIGASEIYKKTHISVAEVNAILEKDFAYFNKAKAHGFIKIIEREYALDLSQWSDEFDEYYQNSTKDEGIFISAKEENGSSSKTLLFIAIGVLLVAGYLFFAQDKPQESVEEKQVTVVEEAKEAIGKNSSDLNETEAEAEVISEVTKEEEEPKPQFFIESSKDLWVGIYYNNNAQREGNVSKGTIILDASRDQIITLGHGQFKLFYKDEIVEPKSENLYRFRLKDGVLTQMSTPVIPPKNDSNQSAKQ